VYAKQHQLLYERSFPVMERMSSCGIECISRIIKTSNGRLYTHFEGGTVGVFDWIEGENTQDERTKIPEYQMLAEIYTVPTKGLNIPQEYFGTDSAELLFKQIETVKQLPVSAVNTKLLTQFDRHQAEIERLYSRLQIFSQACKGDLSQFHITHGDAGGNVIISGDRFYTVDWDDPVLAPPERDAWFCLHWDWATTGFNEALKQRGINYTLRPERLAYYCYHSYFWYLTKYMETFLEYGDPNGALTAEVTDYLANSWIKENISYADKMM
jgi:hypothetical protein